MPERGKGASYNRKKTALRTLMRSVPRGFAFYKILMDLGGPRGPSPAHDRTAAIMGGAYIEFALKQAILVHLKPDESDPECNFLFESDEAPYREFAGRVRLAKALGIPTPDEYRKLEIIRHIRNAFAHTMADISFDDAPIVDLCGDLIDVTKTSTITFLGIPGRDEKPANLSQIFSGMRGKFVQAIVELFVKLQRYQVFDPDDPLSKEFGR